MTINPMRSLAWTLCATILLLFGGCYERYSEPTQDTPLPPRTSTIAALKSLYPEEYAVISQDIVCIGRVTSSDKEGNFYRTLFVEDETGAVEVLVGIYDSYTHYPIGTEVALCLNGCAVEYRDGVLQVGAPKSSYDLYLQEFESQVVLDKHIIRGDIASAAPSPYIITALNASTCGSLVRIDDLHHAPLTEEECSSIVGYHRFVSSQSGYDIYCSVSEYAKFATMAIPEGDIAIVGIVKYESISEEVGKKFVLYPRFASDLLDGTQDLDE